MLRITLLRLAKSPSNPHNVRRRLPPSKKRLEAMASELARREATRSAVQPQTAVPQQHPVKVPTDAGFLSLPPVSVGGMKGTVDGMKGMFLAGTGVALGFALVGAILG